MKEKEGDKDTLKRNSSLWFQFIIMLYEDVLNDTKRRRKYTKQRIYSF